MKGPKTHLIYHVRVASPAIRSLATGKVGKVMAYVTFGG
tara:strand:+ start:21 stop:137 length:117 start_codon:yes stop_codon:yes gene_type:complete